MKSKIFLLTLAVLLIGMVSADFEIGNPSHSIDTSYGTSAAVTGWMNLSFDDEPTDSVFRDSFGNSIELLELLELSSADYECSVDNCESDYEADNAEVSKEASLEEDEEIIFGIQISDDFTDLFSVKFNIDSDAEESCYNQLRIDFLNDGIDSGNTNSSNLSCPNLKTYGCFEEDNSLSPGTLGSVPYCQRIELSESPGFKIGAWVKKTGATNDTLTMKLFNSAGGDLEKSCVLPEASTDGGEISCDINYLVTEKDDYFVCIYSNGSSHETRGYVDSSGCAYHRAPTSGVSETLAMQIFAKGKMFGGVGTLAFNDSSSSLSQMFEDYIEDRYGSLDCDDGCVIPIRLISGTEQTVNLRNLELKYDLGGGLTGTTNVFYDIEETPPKVDADFQKIYLDDSGFKVSSDEGEEDYILYLGGEEIFSEEIEIGSNFSIVGLTPVKTASAFPTEFTIIVNSKENISEYEWSFGNGDAKTTYSNSVSYTYNSTGSYWMTVKVTDDNDVSVSGGFNITVGSPEEVIEELLEEKTGNLENITGYLQGLDNFYYEQLNGVLELEGVEEDLRQLEKDFEGAGTEEEFNNILTDLIGINVPEDVRALRSTDGITFYPKENVIDLDILEEIGGGEYDRSDEDGYVNAILAWNQENLEASLDFKEFSARYDGYEMKVLRTFKFDVKDKGGISEEPYFIIKKLDDLYFKENYLEEEISGYVYIDLTDEGEVVFSTTENVDFEDLPAFISPKISRLSLESGVNLAEDKPSYAKWILFALIVVVIIIVGSFIYVVAQEWYKRNYETHLFKNRNNLYNLLVFIENSKKKGKKYNEIKKELRKAKWNTEQINYAIKKHAGRNTGMFEFPLSKILQKFSKKKSTSVNGNDVSKL